MEVLVLGTSGMLGNAVFSHFENAGYDVCGTTRKEYDFISDNHRIFDAYLHKSYQHLPIADYVINCIGITNRFINNDTCESIYVNSYFPHALANWCKSVGSRMIHITTDCVFSGKDGKYTEGSPHDELDLYGRTKSLGEPSNSAMVLRTSIIGDEIHKFVNLVSWVKSMDGEQVNGFTNHMWNGITTSTYAKICEDIMCEGRHKNGTYHVFSPNDVTKHELLQTITEAYSLDIDVLPCESDSGKIDRTLRSVRSLVCDLNIPDIREQLCEKP